MVRIPGQHLRAAGARLNELPPGQLQQREVVRGVVVELTQAAVGRDRVWQHTGAAKQVIEWADQYAAHWKEARLLECESDRTGRDDPRLVAASRPCLQGRRLQLKAVIDLLLASDADALELAERAFAGVGDARACVGLLAASDARATPSMVR